MIDHAKNAIVVDGVSKRFRLYRDRTSSMKQLLTRQGRSRYEDFWALNDVSLEVPRGLTYGLVGHNGSGKSSLLRLMAGIHRPNLGSVQVQGRVSALLELGAGFHPELSGRENIFLNASILGLGKAEIASRLDEIVEFSGLQEFIDSPVKVYSSGMYVRLGFAVAVHVDPEVLLIDEVIAVGDEEFQRRCFEHLYKLRQQDVTIVLVTHSLGLVQSMCDRAAWLDHGNLMFEGKATEVVRRYLSQVNTAEDARIEAADMVAALHPVSQEHDVDAVARPITIESVEFLNDQGEPVHVVPCGSPLTLRLHYRAKREVTSPKFSFALENEHNLHLATQGSGPVPGIVPIGPGSIDYSIDRLSLGEGTYVISTAIHEEHGMVRFDHHERAWSVKVRKGEQRGFGGTVDLLGRWADPTTLPASS